MTHWSAACGGRERTGTAEDPPAAWQCALHAAAELAAASGGADPITLCVDLDTADVRVAVTETGEPDLPATREGLQRTATFIDEEYRARPGGPAGTDELR